MQCLTPIKIHKDTSAEATVPCGKCAICRANRRAEWITRLRLELLSSEFAQFNSLTYSNKNLRFSDFVDTDTGEVIKKLTTYKRDVQLFLKRLRKMYPDVSIRYFILSEYGDKSLRPHWHGIFFIRGLDLNKIDILKKWYDDFSNCWQLGRVYFGTATVASITYCTKYMFKYGRLPYGYDDLNMLCSRKPALGSDYIDRFRSFNINQHDFSRIRFLGVSSRLPRLFRDKWKESFLSTLTPEQREDEEGTLKIESLRAVKDNIKKLRSEFERGSPRGSDQAFSDFCRWKLEQYKNRVIKNQTKHDKL